MTLEEAIEEMKSYAKYSWGRLSESFEIAIDAIDKQILKNPWFDVENWCCPVCMASFGYASDYIEEMHRFNHCANCGQEIDWSEYIECIKNDSVK